MSGSVRRTSIANLQSKSESIHEADKNRRHLPVPPFLGKERDSVPPKKKNQQPVNVSSAGVHPTPTELLSFEPILTPEQVAERLQIKPRTVYELTRRRSARPLPVLKVGKYLRFRWSEIEQWLNEGRRD